MKDKRNDIWQKLDGKTTGFTKPEAYFSSLEERTALWSKLPKKTGLKVPDGYFENINSNALRIGKKTGFTVPRDYFNTLDKKIITSRNKPTSKIIKLTKHYQLAIAVAACIILFFSIQQIQFGNKVPELKSITQNDIEQYIDGELFVIESSELEDFYTDDLLIADHFINNTDIENYLEDSDLEFFTSEN